MAANDIQRNVRAADLLLARINTRENSTLSFATLAASASLILLGLTADSGGHHDWLRLTAFLFALLGLLYRETTILTVDRRDYFRFYRLVPSLKPKDPEGRLLRRLLIRLLLLSALAATITLVSNSIREIENTLFDGLAPYWLPIITTCLLFWLIFLPALMYGKSRNRKTQRIWRVRIGFFTIIIIAASFAVAYLPSKFLKVSATTPEFAFAALLYVVASSYLLTRIEMATYGYK